jgi:glycosyltransferase involved in cell wall biosynthesis
LELVQRRAGNSNEHFVLVGNGELNHEVSAWFEKKSTDNVHWITHVSQVERLWHIADGMIITSLYEGLPIAMLEALSMETPVLSTDVGDVKLILDEYNAGVVVDTIPDAVAFENSFELWKNNLDFFKRCLNENSAQILSRFSARTLAQQYRACWKQAIEDNNIRKNGVN